jgi:Rrf2 family transcriptional regulator, nitric oxide-sensitive transcriptional repressor
MTMFSSTAEYALRATVYLAMHPGERANSREIAEQTRAPAGYVSKVLQDLAGAGIVVSQRGPNGGFWLARPAEKITVLEVVNAVDPIRRITECPLKIPSHGTTLCRLHRKLDDAIAMIEKTLGGSSLAEMCEPAKAGGRLIYPTVDAPRKGKGAGKGS